MEPIIWDDEEQPSIFKSNIQIQSISNTPTHDQLENNCENQGFTVSLEVVKNLSQLDSKLCTEELHSPLKNPKRGSKRLSINSFGANDELDSPLKKPTKKTRGKKPWE